MGGIFTSGGPIFGIGDRTGVRIKVKNYRASISVKFADLVVHQFDWLLGDGIVDGGIREITIAIDFVIFHPHFLADRTGIAVVHNL